METILPKISLCDPRVTKPDLAASRAMEREKGVRKAGRSGNTELASVLMAVVMDRCR